MKNLEKIKHPSFLLGIFFCGFFIFSTNLTAQKHYSLRPNNTETDSTFNLGYPKNLIINKSDLLNTYKGGEWLQFTSDSSIDFYRLLHIACKSPIFSMFLMSFDIYQTPVKTVVPHAPAPTAYKYSEKKINGDVFYEISRHTSLDTSLFNANYLQQRFVANLYATIFKKYPIMININAMETSLPYVRNYLDMNIQFDRKRFNNNIKDNYKEKIMNKLSPLRYKDSLLSSKMSETFSNGHNIASWLENENQIQQLMDSYTTLERLAARQTNASSQFPSLKDSSLFLPLSSTTISSDSARQTKMAQRFAKLEVLKSILSVGKILLNKSSADSSGRLSFMNDSLQTAFQYLEKYKDSLYAYKLLKQKKDSLEQAYALNKKQVNQTTDSLNYLLNKEGFLPPEDSSNRVKSDKWLSGVRQIGLGKAFVNYSPLTVQNLNITGVNIEYAKRYYFALVAGKINYRYYSFWGSSNNNTNAQGLVMARFGIGEPLGKHIYFSWYMGKKVSGIYTNNIPVMNKISGISVEVRLPINKTTFFLGEIGKSNYPSLMTESVQRGKMLSFSDRSNEAYLLQLNSYIKQTDTYIFAEYAKLGAYFQSFNVFNLNTKTSAWQARLTQYFLRKRLSLMASAKQNNYTTPYVENDYKNRLVFYSFQMSIRLKKLPVITLGYMPSAHLVRLNNEIRQNTFYTLTGTANYSYRFLKKYYMNSAFVYTQYINNDNYLYANAKNYFFSQSVFFKRFNLTGIGNYVQNTTYNLNSLGANFSWSVSNFLRLGGGATYNSFTSATVSKTIGYNWDIELCIGKIGTIGFSYEKGFLPYNNNLLIGNDWGKIKYYKSF